MSETHLSEEAQAFNQRILERERQGFVPDLRRAIKCEWFYKSFWRDPHFVKLYLGENVERFLQLLKEHGKPKSRILDVGCGSGYISLELARAGHSVTAIDIAERAIESATRTLATNPFKEGFGSLKYKVSSLAETDGEFDVVLFSGVLHHSSVPEEMIRKALLLLPTRGLVLAHEPCHEAWGHADAAQVALIRGLLSLTGFWYEGHLRKRVNNLEGLNAFIEEIHTEYETERDPSERGQSPNDNSSSGKAILDALRSNTRELHYSPGASFIYRLLGGMRGIDDVVHPVADFITLYEKYIWYNTDSYSRITSFLLVKRIEMDQVDRIFPEPV